MTASARLTGEPAPVARAADLALLLDQLGHAARSLWRSRFVLVFTFVIPLMWLVLIGLIAGNELVDPTSGVRVMQFVTPMAAVLGVVFASFPPVATALALAREQRVLKRLRGTPLPPWIYLLGQVGAAMLLAGVALAVMLGLGVAAYGVQLQARSIVASLVTLALGIACLASMGLAVGALAPTSQTAQAFAMASSVLMGFVSGLFRVGGDEPAWMTQVGAWFPMRNIGDPLRDQFDPYGTGAGWEPGPLAVLAAWGIGSLVVAAWALRRERLVAARAAAAPAAAEASTTAAPVASLRAVAAGRPGIAGLVLDQSVAAIRTAQRNPSIVFFAIVLPVGLYAMVCSMYPSLGNAIHGVTVGVWFAAGMTTYGAGVIGFMYLPSHLATARDRLALKRLRGTPLPAWVYLAGRAIQVLVLSALLGVLMVAVGWVAFDVRLTLEGAAAGLVVLLFGALAMTACGFAVAAVLPTARAASVVTMAILLPLSFISEVFVVGSIPEPVPTFASLFPLKHAVAALAAAIDPAGVTILWGDLGVVAAWLVGATLVAVRLFRWEAAPSSGGGSATPARRRRRLLRRG